MASLGRKAVRYHNRNSISAATVIARRTDVTYTPSTFYVHPVHTTFTWGYLVTLFRAYTCFACNWPCSDSNRYVELKRVRRKRRLVKRQSTNRDTLSSSSSSHSRRRISVKRAASSLRTRREWKRKKKINTRLNSRVSFSDENIHMLLLSSLLPLLFSFSFLYDSLYDVPVYCFSIFLRGHQSCVSAPLPAWIKPAQSEVENKKTKRLKNRSYFSPSSKRRI